MRERIAVIFAFILIFAFSSVDNAISPMVEHIAESYKISMGSVLRFISVCTAGTVLGVFFGPWLVAKLRPAKLLLLTSLLLFVTQAGFLVSYTVQLGILSRFLSGFCTGAMASVMWWMTFHGVSRKYYHDMIAVLMSARPLATAIGVPLAGFVAWSSSWHMPYWWLASLMLAAGVALVRLMPAGDGVFSESGFFEGYRKAFSVPHALQYYIGFTVNRMCYFGFYAVAGIWFIEHYGLNLKKMSVSLLVIGLAEALVNFNAARLIRKLGHKFTFNWSISLSFVLLAIFIWGKTGFKTSIALITAFMLLDRIYSMALVIKIPEMFPTTGDKTVFGSLNTLTAWLGLSVISAVASKVIPKHGIFWAEVMLLASFAVGSLLLYGVQVKTVYPKRHKKTGATGEIVSP